MISIHAPRVGRDHNLGQPVYIHSQFQSTRPVWGATSCVRGDRIQIVQFQSTRPVWGATSARSTVRP